MVYTFLNLESSLSQNLAEELKYPSIWIKSIDSNFILMPSQISSFKRTSKSSFIEFPFFENIQTFLLIQIMSRIQISTILNPSFEIQIILGLDFKILWF
jgi:hypothetical protein